MTAMDAITGFIFDPLYFRIFYLTILLFVTGCAIWLMYISLSRRDLFKISHQKGKDKPNFLDKAAYAFKYIFFFPVLTFLWYVLFVACLAVLSGKQNLEEIMLLGVVIVSAVRIAAYVSQRMAEDVAKMLPLTLLAGVILNPSFITLDTNLEQVNVILNHLPAFGKYLLFIIALELALKVGRALHIHFFQPQDSAGEKSLEKGI